MKALLQREHAHASRARTTTEPGKRPVPGSATRVPAWTNALARQPAKPPTVSAWKALPPDAQQVLEDSFYVYRHVQTSKNDPRWLWARAIDKTAEDCFNQWPSDYQLSFLEIYKAMTNAHLWLWVEFVSQVYNSSGVKGMTFQPDLRDDLAKRLSGSQDFCEDTLVGRSFGRSRKWRQLSAVGTPSLHITLPSSGSCDAHIDTVTPVEGRESDGKCNYAIGQGIRHISKDLLHLPID